MKGIGILLVIIGHQDGVAVPLKHFIYAFHMPLFFILAGCFYKPKDITKQLFFRFPETGIALFAVLALLSDSAIGETISQT